MFIISCGDHRHTNILEELNFMLTNPQKQRTIYKPRGA